MNAKMLTNSIISFALHGKLVPQFQDDDSAIVLLQRLKKKKHELYKAGIIKKSSIIDFTVNENECPYELPDNWIWVSLSDLATFFNGDRSSNYPNKNEYVSEGVAWINTGHIESEGVLSRTTMNFISREKFDSLSGGKIMPGDLVYCLRGATYGKVSRVDPFDEGAIASSLMIIRPLDIQLREYIFLYLKSQLAKSCLLSFANGAAQPNLAAKDVAKYLVPLPPLEEQKRIVAKLDEILPLVEKYGKSQEALDKLNASLPQQLKASILQEAIQGKLVPQDPNDEPACELLKRIGEEKAKLTKVGKIKKKDTITKQVSVEDTLFDVPHSWAWCRIGDLFVHSNGKQLNKGSNQGTKMKYITTSNLYWGYFLLDSLKEMPFTDSEIERCQAIKGDLLVCEGGDIGRSSIWTYDYPIMLQNHLHKLRSYIPMCTKYFYYLFYYYNKTGQIGGKGIGIQGFSSSALHDTLVPLPPIPEQERIVAKLDELFSKIDSM